MIKTLAASTLFPHQTKKPSFWKQNGDPSGHSIRTGKKPVEWYFL